MYVHWKLLGVCLATCTAALLVSNDAGNSTHLAAGEGAERGAEARPVVKRMAAIARRRWGAKSCVEFHARLVNQMDSQFAEQIERIAVGEECFKQWMSSACHEKMKTLLSHTMFQSLWGLAMWPLDLTWRSLMYFSGGFMENTAGPLLFSSLDKPITKLQEKIQRNEGKFIAYEEMYQENLNKAVKGDEHFITYLTENIGAFCKAMGMYEEGEDVDAMVVEAMVTTKGTARSRTLSSMRKSHASAHHPASED